MSGFPGDVVQEGRRAATCDDNYKYTVQDRAESALRAIPVTSGRLKGFAALPLLGFVLQRAKRDLLRTYAAEKTRRIP